MKNTRKLTKKLSVNDLSRLENIFTSKSWPVETEIGENIFDSFCNMLSSFEQEEIDLILDLTKNFLWIKESQYIKLFCESFKEFYEKQLSAGIQQIVLCPLLSESDFNKPKSSILLLYFIKANLLALQNRFCQINIYIIDSPAAYNPAMLSKNHSLCLIDDYIGTGSTAISAANYFINKQINISSISILSLVAMRSGIDFLRQMGYNTFADIILDKGIEGSVNADQKYKVMEMIEAKIAVKDDYHLGFGHSEALVKMVRTPNNTFPIYWLRNRKNPYAPFPR